MMIGFPQEAVSKAVCVIEISCDFATRVDAVGIGAADRVARSRAGHVERSDGSVWIAHKAVVPAAGGPPPRDLTPQIDA
jgi:hypothetical protein